MPVRCLMDISHSFSRRLWPVLPEAACRAEKAASISDSTPFSLSSEMAGLLRSASFIAFQGVYQQTPAEKPAQMLRLSLSSEIPCVPEISANKYVLNIRFLAQNGEETRAKTADWDVGFELTFCNL